MTKIKITDWDGQILYIGIDLHKTKWVMTVRTKDLELKTFTSDGRKEVLLQVLHRNWPSATFKAVYEAGYFGYHLADYLDAHGIETIIVSPQKIPKQPGYFVKTDKIDSRKLAKYLANGLLEGIYRWNVEALHDRSLVRKRGQMVKRRVQIQSQIKADLAFYGVEIKTTQSGYWSQQYITQLKEYAQECPHQHYGNVLALMIKEYDWLQEGIRKVTQSITQLSQTDRYRNKVTLLRWVPGISVLSAMILLTEIGDISRFLSAEKFASFLGLTPAEYSSGEKIRKGSLTGMGHRILRTLFVELSWVAIRKDPALLEKFNRVRQGKSKTKAIIAVAKSMANRVRHILIMEEPYVIGVVG